MKGVKGLGLLPLAFLAAHVAYYVRHEHPSELLWTCNAACLLIGASCLLSRRTGVAIGLSWLSFGIPLWLLDVATGSPFIPTSVLTHLGGFAVGALAIKRLGWPERTWWKASAALLGLLLVTRALTPPKANVNLVFSVYEGWERYFPTYGVYFALIVTAAFLTFLAFERAVMRLAPR